MPIGRQLAFSILTNPEALAGLRNLNSINAVVAEHGQRVSTGQKVRGAIDDASNFAIAQGIRADIRATQAIIQGLNNARGVAQVAVAGATAVSDLMNDIRVKIIEASNPGNTTEQQQILQNDYAALVGQMRTYLENAEYNDTNILIETAIPFNTIPGTVNDIDVLARLDGGTIRLRGQQLDLVYARLVNETVNSTAAATQALGVWESNISIVNGALGELGADSRELKLQIDNLNEILDTTTVGLGNIVDADLARESAELAAAQVQQQLSVQTLGIAQNQPRIIQSLFE